MATHDWYQSTAQPASPSNHYPVHISKMENGFLVAVGCKNFVAKTWNEVSEGLALYYANPSAAQKKYCKE